MSACNLKVVSLASAYQQRISLGDTIMTRPAADAFARANADALLAIWVDRRQRHAVGTPA